MATVLVVDDQAINGIAASLSLECAGHSVVVARSGNEAALLAALIEVLDLVIVDQRISRNRGCDIVNRLVSIHPKIKVMYVSGWFRPEFEYAEELQLGAGFLAKPFTSEQIRTAVSSLLSDGRDSACDYYLSPII